MKRISFATIYALTLIFTTICQENNVMIKVFDTFIKQYNKTYTKGSTVYLERYRIFKNNFDQLSTFIITMKSDETAQFGITQFSDISPEEFKEKYLTTIQPYNNLKTHTKTSLQREIPEKFDWRDNKTMTPIKNQLNCGSCWAFTFTELVESMTAIGGGQLERLSVQEALDCTSPAFSCDLGGNHCFAARVFYEQKKKIVLEDVYPYEESKGQCHTPQSKFAAVVTSFACHSFLGAESEMINLIWKSGPLAVAVDATMWQFYKGGILQYHCGTKINHAVVIVGFDFSGPVPYYIVRNSWGAIFGNNGYLKLAYGKNVCGLTNSVLNLSSKQYQ